MATERGGLLRDFKKKNQDEEGLSRPAKGLRRREGEGASEGQGLTRTKREDTLRLNFQTITKGGGRGEKAERSGKGMSPRTLREGKETEKPKVHSSEAIREDATKEKSSTRD